jgi:hypothetical protein
MAIITNNTLNSFASTFLTLEGEVNTTVRNLIKHHKNAGIESISCPSDNYVFTLDDGSVEVVSSEVVYLRLTSASKNALDDLSSWKYGRLVKGIMLTDYATSAYVGTVKATTKAIKHVISASSQLKADITRDLMARIDDIKLTLASATTTAMIDDYLSILKSNNPVYIDGIGIDAHATIALINLEALQEIIEQIESVFEGTKTEYDTSVLDSSTIEVQLSSFDDNNMPAIIERLSKFNLTGTFDADKTKVLKRLNVQILTIKL